jgi:hypothetical protein
MKPRRTDLARRQLILKSLYGGVSSAFALEYLGGVPLLGNYLAGSLLDPLASSLDAYPLIADAARGGSSLLKVHQALALSSSNDWSIVTIKVVNHVSTPLVFGLGKILEDGSLNIGPDATPVANLAGAAKNYLTDAGVLKISDIMRYRNLRLNKWFADILHNGTSDGKAPSGANLLGVPATAVAPFPSNVAIQAALHLHQTADDVNHSIRGFKVRSNKPDLAKYIQDLGIVKSPLGITCFMMGNQYDKAEGSTAKNIVCGAVGEAPTVASRTVDEYVRSIAQNINSGYSDLRAPAENLTNRFDMLSRGNSALRKELIESRSQFVAVLDGLREASALEQANRQVFDASISNGQSGDKTEKGAGTEFLGQCLYTARAISNLEGNPLRNFSLFLNMNDLDEQSLDNLVTNGDNAAEIRALTYIEGMRQLAMGLNILAKPIAEGKKVIVQVLSEGGRSRNMGDSKVGFMFILGPSGPGMLADNLMANMAAINTPNSAVVQDPGNPVKTAVQWESKELTEENGTPSAVKTLPTVGDVQMGVVDFIANVTGQTEKLEPGRGRYVKLKVG